MMESTETQMHVEIGFFEGDNLLHKGHLLLTPEKVFSCYGNHNHFSISCKEKQLEVALFSGLIIEHSFAYPVSTLTLYYFEVIPTENPQQPFRQERRIKADSRMPVHLSDDWESIELDKYTLAFKCTPLC